MRLCYTRHAWTRVHERLSLTPLEVAEILDRDRAVNIGIEAGSTRVHRLFYSPPDREWFVAVVDQADGVLVTILPVDYHERFAWTVSEQAQQLARKLVITSGLPIGSRPGTRADEAIAGSGAHVFRIAAYVYDDLGHVKVLSLGSWPAQPYGGLVERLLDDERFFDAVGNRLTARGFPLQRCEAVYVRLGRLGPLRVSLRDVG